MKTPVVVHGRSGRMARLIAEAVTGEPDLELLGRADTRGPAPRAVLDRAAPTGRPPVVVDFTAREATAGLLEHALTVPCALVIGTSGLGDAERALLAEVGRRRAVVTAANFSLALLLVAQFVHELSRQTGPGWDAGVMDVHFAGKRDRPSATARFLADQWRPAAGSRAAGDRPPDGRSPGDGSVPQVAAFRLGDAVSEHRLLAAGPGEHVEVVHRVADRAAFLPGILRSVRFAAVAEPGHYSLEDVAVAARG